MALVPIIAQGPFNKATEKRTKPSGPALGCGVQRKCRLLSVLGCAHLHGLLACKDRAGRALGPPSLAGQVIRGRGQRAEADGIGPGLGYGEASTRQGGWVVCLSSSLPGTQAIGGDCLPGERRGCCLPYTGRRHLAPASALPKLFPTSIR